VSIKEIYADLMDRREQDERVRAASRIVGEALVVAAVAAALPEKKLTQKAATTTRGRVFNQAFRLVPLAFEPGSGVVDVVVAHVRSPLMRRAMVGHGRASRAAIAFSVAVIAETTAELGKAQLRKLAAVRELDSRGLKAKGDAFAARQKAKVNEPIDIYDFLSSLPGSRRIQRPTVQATTDLRAEEAKPDETVTDAPVDDTTEKKADEA
jgi:hypothetical protein